MVMDTPSAQVTPETAERLQRSLRGEVIWPAHPDYEQHRKVWNGMIDRRPHLIARCVSTEDVIAAVNFARDQGIHPAVRGGGHSFAGFSTSDGGLVVDLAPMKNIEIDPAARVAHAEAGLTWGEFDRATHAHGLGATGGLVSSTGIAGLTLGGGIGWLMRKHGLACDNLLAVELVTAEGRRIRATATENQDLFWGVRGGGGNFGIVTSFDFRLHSISTVVGGLMLFPADRSAEIMRFYRQYIRDVPDEMTTMLTFITAPRADFIPATLQGHKAVAFAGAHCGDADAANRSLELVRGLNPAVDLFEPMAYPDLQAMFDEDYPPGVRCYVKAGYAADCTDSMIDVIVEHTARMASPASTLDFHHMGGAVARVPDGGTAFGDRSSTFCFNVVGVWTEPNEDETHLRWVRDFAAALEPFRTGGVYVNFTAESGGARAVYDERRYERLSELKRRYDPGNLFRLNQNIEP
jgi:FAD/FMN-containing dehydrogenase